MKKQTVVCERLLNRWYDLCQWLEVKHDYAPSEWGWLMLLLDSIVMRSIISLRALFYVWTLDDQDCGGLHMDITKYAR